MFVSMSFVHPFVSLTFVALAAAVARQPVTGVASYKPANSDAGGDLYINDFVGMLGIPLVPTSTFPKDADAIFLPTQAAKDEAVVAQSCGVWCFRGRAARAGLEVDHR